MDEESYSDAAIDVKPINKNCNPNQKVEIVDNNTGAKNNQGIDETSNKANVQASYDKDPNPKPLYGGINKIYGLKNYEIKYKKKNFLIKTFNIDEALFHLVDSLKIKNDCLFEVKEIGLKKNSIYHFKNNKRKVINKIR